MKYYLKKTFNFQKEHPRRNRLFDLLKVTVPIFLIIFAILNCGGGSSPSATVRSCFDAMLDGDFEKASKYIVDGEEQLEKFKASGMLHQTATMIKAVDIDYRILDEIVNGDEAEVKVEILLGGEVNSTDIVPLKIVDGKWKMIQRGGFSF